jgi:hypothetical protein
VARSDENANDQPSTQREALRRLRSFKRYCRWAGDALRQLKAGGGVSLRSSYASGEMRSEIIVPREEAATRFSVVMRHFLDPSDPLNIRTMVAWLRARYGDSAISAADSADIERLLDQVDEGQIGIQVNGLQLRTEKVYELMANGAFFGAEERSKSFVESLQQVPIVGALFWFQFYTYAQDCYVVVSRLLDSAQLAEEAERARSPINEPRLSPQCIYCLSTRGSFGSEEHVFPEGLGNDEIVLPRGYVCDKCNNGPLSALDDALLQFGPIALLRVLYVPHGKGGKLPKAKFKNVNVTKAMPTHIVLKSAPGTGDVISERRELADGWHSFKLNLTDDRHDPVRLGRALFKVALGLVALDHGPAAVMASRYEAARLFVLGRRSFANNLVVFTEARPEQVVIAQNWLAERGTAVVMSIFGVRFIFNLEEEPIVDPARLPSGVGTTVFSLNHAQSREKVGRKAHGRKRIGVAPRLALQICRP